MFNTNRIYLKILRKQQIPELLKLLKNDSAQMLCEYYGIGMNDKKIGDLFEHRINSLSQSSMDFLVYLSKSHKIIGFATLTNLNFVKGHSEMSTLIANEYLGLGYGPLVYKLLVQICFTELNLVKVVYKIRADNNWIPNRDKNQLLRRIPLENGIVHDYYYGEILKSNL